MVFIPALNTVRVALDQIFGTQAMANILYFAATGGWDETSMTNLADDLIDWWKTQFVPIKNSASALTGVTVTDIETETGPSITVPVVSGGAGTADGPATPGNAAAVVTFRTAGRGRSSRGRNYIGGMDMDNIASVTDISTALASHLIADYEALDDVETANSCTHVVVSFYHAKAPRTVGLVQPVTAYTCDTAIDSQRRRLRGRGV